MPEHPIDNNQDGNRIKKSNIDNIPPLTLEEQSLLEQANSQFLAQLQADPQLRQEFLQLLKHEASKPDNQNLHMFSSHEEGLRHFNSWLNGSVSPGKVEIKGPSLFLEAPKWPHWNEIDITKEYNLQFQWQHKQFSDRFYFMLVIDFLGLKRSLRVAFNLVTDYFKLKMFQGEQNFIIVPNIDEFLQGLRTQNFKPALIIQGIKPELLNMIDVAKAGLDAQNFKK